jgi:hypothetical protein
MLSTGLTMHYDLIAGNTANFASNALDWSLKWKHEFTTVQLELKSHSGWTFFGSSEYYPFAETPELRETDNNYGTGANVKLFFSLQNRRYGKITAGICSYLLYVIPWNKPDSRGIEFLNLTFLEYSYSFTHNLSVFASSSLHLKAGTSHRRANVFSAANRIILALQWTFLDKGYS